MASTMFATMGIHTYLNGRILSNGMYSESNVESSNASVLLRVSEISLDRCRVSSIVFWIASSFTFESFRFEDTDVDSADDMVFFFFFFFFLILLMIKNKNT